MTLRNLNLITLILNLLIVLVYGCDPLIYREGVEVNCHDSENSRASIDCYSKSKQIPVGTVARYKCQTPFYVPSNSEITDNDRILKCNSRGKWSGGGGLSRFHLFTCTLNCGVTDLGSFTGLIQGGTKTKQANWPWHATLFARPNSEYPFTYICGGSLIKPHGSKGYVVVTAAHCVATNRQTARNVNDVTVVLGSEESSLNGIEDHSPDAQIFKVKQITIHKSYGGGRADYQSDIALIRLVEPVKIKLNILPICLSKTAGLPNIGEIGHVAGFGLYQKNADAVSIHLRTASFPVVNPDECFEWRSRKLLPQEYCGGTASEQNACNGDSGGGMVFNGTDENRRKRFYLQGVVSHGRVNINDEGACDNYSVYTKVSHYIDWIYEFTEKLFEDDDEESSDISPPSSTTVRTTTPVKTTPTTTTATSTTTRRTRPPSTIRTTTEFLFPESPKVEIVDERVPLPTGKDYEIEAVQRHNYYRRMHGVPNVRLNERLSRLAQENAESQLRQGIFVNRQDIPGANKNIYKFLGRQRPGPDAVRAAIDEWYNDVINFDWYSPVPSTFTQVVWKSTSEIGVGLASINRNNRVEQMVVVVYSPSGNIQGRVQENVFPKM